VPEGSRATKASPSAGFLSEDNLRRIAALNDIAAGRGQSLAQMAIAWALRGGRVTSALIGASRPEQVSECVAARQGAGTLHLPEREARLDRGDIVEPGQLVLEEALIGGEVADDDAQQSSRAARSSGSSRRPRASATTAGEAVELLLALALELDRGEDRDRQAELVLVDDRDIALDDAGLLQQPDPARARAARARPCSARSCTERRELICSSAMILRSSASRRRRAIP
jgi:hypothetical protein